MTGRGGGFCILRTGGEDGDTITGFAGLDGKRVEVTSDEGSAFAQGLRRRSPSYGGQVGGCFAKEVSQMPRGDGTGPMGMGPMTGRAAGYCAGNTVPGYMTPGPGRGSRLRQGYGGQVGMGYGRGRGGGGRGLGLGFCGGHGWGGCPPYVGAPTAGQELDVLRGQAEYFGGALEDIKKRIEELETGKKAE